MGMYNPAQPCIGVHSPAGARRTSQERAQAYDAYTTHMGTNPYTGIHSHVWKCTALCTGIYRHIKQSGVCLDFHGHTPDCGSIHNPIHTSWAHTPNVHAQPQMEHAHRCMCTHNPRQEHTPDRHSQPHGYMHNSGLAVLEGHIQP